MSENEGGWKMFKERLNIVVRKFGFGLINVCIALLFLALIIGTAFLAMKYPIIDKIVMYLIYFMIAICVLFIIASVLMKIYSFINWLFVEPYKKTKKKS